MKKYHLIPTLFIAFLLSFSISHSVDASEKTNNIQELHDLIIEQNLVRLNEKGQLEINEKANAEYLKVSMSLFNDYTADLKKMNTLVEDDLLTFDENFQPVIYSPEEISQIVYEKSLSNPSERIIIDNQPVTIFADPSAPPSRNIKNLVIANRNNLESFLSSQKSLVKWGGGNPYTATIGYFVGKVKPKGSWDYKTVSGYAPWYKKFLGTFFDGTKVIDSAYIGNYNYGYTGELLFSKKDLLAAGDGVSIITSFMTNIQKGEFKASLDSEGDKAPVRRGFDNAVKYD
ncbi:hypothetical protein FQ085_13855 [Planococcus sp. ANT_H30]|uniref:Bacterial toxin 44 domain-containing protein n=1 Tax=Planococcus kocurii TaxID=1374 RepID=A0ABM5WSN0_9BACL|nr:MULTISPECIES: polymorphic toxin type 44 domain-containing protein [Planococcus]ALS77271.1 hypothetical protein AUO94_00810 [Planococcus kocurii]KAA0956198.1 hypothetical protein FQ085_13855 [Planococcus sp. ANT_H30]